MKVTVSEDLQWLNIHYDSELERQQLEVSFTKFIRNHRFRTKGKKWNGSVAFYNSGKVKVGLWKKLHGMCKKFGFPFEITGLRTRVFREEIKREEIEWFCMELIKGHPKIKSIRDHQIDAVWKLLVYRYALGDLSTSAGKSLIIFFYIMFLRHKKLINKALIICHDADSVIQLYDEFIDYANMKFKVNACMVHGGTKVHDVKDYKIIIGNFQTLSNRPEEFFEGVDYVISDEVQRATNDSIQNIIQLCGYTKGRIGVSGSLKEDDTADIWSLYKTFGPIVTHIKKKELMDKGEATPIEIKIFILNWATVEQRKYLAELKIKGNTQDVELLKIEQQVVRESKVRLRWIIKLISQIKGNTLVLFIDKKNGYGKKVVELLKLANLGKEVFYIDGDIDPDTRDYYKKQMEIGDNKILVATYQTYGTGKSIKNLHYIVCIESMKGFNIIQQAMGRGMRLHESKDKYVWIDIVDDMSIIDRPHYDNRNFMMKHYDERLKQYKSDGFDFDIYRINLDSNENEDNAMTLF